MASAWRNFKTIFLGLFSPSFFGKTMVGFIIGKLYVKEKTVVKGFLNDIIESTFKDGNLRLGTMFSFDSRKKRLHHYDAYYLIFLFFSNSN